MNTQKLGALQVALAAICWSFAGVFCKWIPWSAYTIIGLRGLFSALILAALRGGFRVRITRGTALGALGSGVTGILFLMATKLTSSASAIVLQYAMPIFVLLLSWIFYHQKPGKADFVTTICVLAGVALCSLEGMLSGGSRMTGNLLALMAAMTYSLVFFCARMPGANTQDYVYLGCVICIPLALYGFWDPQMTLKPTHFLAIAAMGLCYAGGNFFIAASLKRVRPITGALLANLEPVLNPLWVFLFLGENPGISTIFGAVIVLGSITVYSIRSQKHGNSPS